MKLLAGSSHTKLGQELAKILGISIVKTELGQFANGEKRVWIQDDLHGQDVVVLQSLCSPVDENLVELLLLVDALDRSGARNIRLVVPWLGYSLQDKVFRKGEPIAAKVVCDVISNMRVERIFLLDLHNSSLPGFFSVPTEQLSAQELFVEYVKKTLDLKNTIVTSPDFGGLKRAREFSQALDLKLTSIDKTRDLNSGETQSKELHGDVEDKDVLIFDDVINTGSTISSSAKLLKKQGAKNVYFFATHGIFANGFESLDLSLINKIIVTNSIPQSTSHPKLEVLSIADTIAESLKT